MEASSTPEKVDLAGYLEQKTKSALFAGWYTDRIFVEEAKGYRDRIRIDEAEADIIKRLKSVFRRVKKEKKLCGLESTKTVTNKI